MRRHATLASVSKLPGWGIDTTEGARSLMQDTATFVRRAARMGADLVAFPEIYPQMRAARPVSHAEPEDAGTLDAARGLARQHKLYLVWPRYERAAGGRIWNSAVLIGRDGQVVGRYHKMFPTIGEMEDGVSPAARCPVFETDFGRVAMIICYDLNFREVRDELRGQRPDVLVFCSAYRGGRQCEEWALDLGCHVVTSVPAELGRIVDPGGKVLQLATYESLIVQRVNLNKRLLHMDYNWDKMDAMLERYGPDLTFEYYTPEARYVIGYEREDRDVDEIIKEFKLEPIGAYFARARAVRQKHLKPA